MTNDSAAEPASKVETEQLLRQMNDEWVLHVYAHRNERWQLVSLQACPMP